MNTPQNDKDFSTFSKWSIRKISFVGILIAISVAFFLVVVQFAPFAALPSLKISIIGLPIKITGFIFGPVVGGFVGAIAELLSFMFVPTYFNPLFLTAAILDGVIPGIISWLFLRLISFFFGGDFKDSIFEETLAKMFKKLDKLKKEPIKNENKIIALEDKIIKTYSKKVKHEQKTKDKSGLATINMFICIGILVLIMLLVVYIIGFRVPDSIIKGGVIANRWALLLVMLSGYCAMLGFVVIARFKFKPKLYLIIMPIIIFSAVIELFNVPILSLADKYSIEKTGTQGSILVYMFQHIIISPVKIWGNMFIIYFTYKIVAPLIYKNHSITYQ
ncbi:ECF transporter S component [Mycoplasmopsis mucosicanis]|uniref:ECF transporter S component n=1 Tax=Mycoplasmopsis mucosicanis TaxID=458208 RepID=A0A507SQ68_9BACT|nr:ECF transporter S component [Mycoplasmopsis mucosicanis]TQC51478.1 ECF transporter S component [Mycoplasmopsis mucosicanis]